MRGSCSKIECQILHVGGNNITGIDTGEFLVLGSTSHIIEHREGVRTVSLEKSSVAH